MTQGVVARATDVEHGIKFQLRDGFLWVEARVAQSSEPLRFLLDSGAEVSTLNSETARRLGLKRGKVVTVKGVGSRGKGYWPVTVAGSVGGVSLPKQFLVADLCELQASCQCPIDGLLGADFFRHRIIQLDFVCSEIRLLAASPVADPGEFVPIRFRRDIMQVPLDINGHEKQWVRLDTGCASALEWVSAVPITRGRREKISIGLSPIRVWTAQTSIRLGKWKFEDVRTGLHSAPLFESENGLLGLGLLSRFERVTIDARAGKVVLCRRAE